jgi:hypothetical protein
MAERRDRRLGALSWLHRVVKMRGVLSTMDFPNGLEPRSNRNHVRRRIARTKSGRTGSFWVDEKIVIQARSPLRLKHQLNRDHLHSQRSSVRVDRVGHGTMLIKTGASYLADQIHANHPRQPFLAAKAKRKDADTSRQRVWSWRDLEMHFMHIAGDSE